MRRTALLLVPLFLFACDREPVAPDASPAPALGAAHETAELTVYDLEWYTAMDCLGYPSGDPPDAVH